MWRNRTNFVKCARIFVLRKYKYLDFFTERGRISVLRQYDKILDFFYKAVRVSGRT